MNFSGIIFQTLTETVDLVLGFWMRVRISQLGFSNSQYVEKISNNSQNTWIKVNEMYLRETTFGIKYKRTTI